MEVSTFELLVKRIAPPPAPNSVARRVVQGYFLTISNLEDEGFRYTLDFHISLPSPPDADRTLAGNAVVLLDVAGANQPLTLTPTSADVTTTRFSTSFFLGAKQTASLQLLPNINDPGLLSAPNPDLEVRGFVQLRLPAIFQFFPRLQRVAQSDRPVKVLLNPEIRGTFLPNNFPSGGGDFDQINYPLELASGRGLNEVEPEPGGPIIVFPDADILDPIDQLPLADLPMIDLRAMDETERVSALIEVMGQIEPTKKNMQNINNILSKLEIPVGMKLVSK